MTRKLKCPYLLSVKRVDGSPIGFDEEMKAGDALAECRHSRRDSDILDQCEHYPTADWPQLQIGLRRDFSRAFPDATVCSWLLERA